ncbi:two-component sensor histidine kinase [Streptomyces nitrosporeus]|uniref:histidine kinase n=1 Tax=Streptomyces nitrosporeus TaxID=28894 RepID=A0A5J6F893_9ACTN|nr:histidine kinase [Streptomyces nitrosporeus]QEU71774.1 two-component sensor histidine kinase [Streptomyces nitrosporeus]GGY94365.1 two-component sensor histidine kinase [Streptomyces nitrosporeus]
MAATPASGLAVLARGRTYTRALHLLTGAAVGPVCTLVYPGFPESLARTLLLSALVPVPLLLLLGMLPGVRRAEGIQARLLLVPRDENEISLARADSFTERRRTGVWLVVRMWWGLLFAGLLAQLLSLTGTVAAAPAAGGVHRAMGLEIQGGREHIWYLVFVPPLLLLVAVVVVGAGEVQLMLAARLLGPSPAERLADAERRAEDLLARNRLAGELHDSLGHALTASVLQAGAARELIDVDRDFVVRALTAIEETGRRALEDLERTLGYLKGEEDGPVRAARPTLEDIGPLLEASRAAGVAVTCRAAASFEEVPGVVAREAYRIIQESLTNAMKHAPGSAVDIGLDITGGRLEISVANTLVEEAGRVPGTGKGLRGLRERAALLGGRATAGAESGRWTVSASLPLRLGS